MAALIAWRALALIVGIVILMTKGYLFIVGEYFTTQKSKAKTSHLPTERSPLFTWHVAHTGRNTCVMFPVHRGCRRLYYFHSRWAALHRLL